MTWSQFSYRLCVFLSAACGLVVEIVAGRMLAPYVGMSIYSWTAVIAVVLAGMSLGNWLGGYLAERSQRQAMLWLTAAFVGGAVSTIGALGLIRLVSEGILSALPNPVTGIVALTAALFFLPSLCVGIPAPILTELTIAERPDRRGRILGQMYALGAVGSIAGTLAAGYLFISWMGTAMTLVVVTAAYLAMACLVLLEAVGGAPGRRPAIAGALAILCLLVIGSGTVLAARATACDRESQYFCIRVEDLTDQVGARTNLLVLDHLAHGMNVRDAPQVMLSPYIAAMDAMVGLRLGEEDEARAFFIGGGAYTLPRAWLETRPQITSTVAEIDPAVTEVAAQRFWVDTSRFKIVHADGRIVLQSQSSPFDIIVGDAFKDLTIPHHLVTVDFARLARDRLTERGVFLMNLVDDVREHHALLAMVRTLSEVFEAVEVWVAPEQVAAGGRATFLLVAARTPSAVDRLEDSHGSVWLRWPPDQLAAKVAASGAPILTDDYAPIDRLLGATIE